VRITTFAIAIGPRSPLATQQILDTGGEFLETSPMVLRSRFLAFSATVMVACTLALCPAQAQKQEPAQYLVLPELSGILGGNLVASIGADPAPFHRLFASGLSNALVADPLAADPVHINRSTHKLEPSLAARWEVARDGRTFVQMPAIPTAAPNILSGWKNTVGNIRPSILVPYLLWNTAELTKRAR